MGAVGGIVEALSLAGPVYGVAASSGAIGVVSVSE